MSDIKTHGWGLRNLVMSWVIVAAIIPAAILGIGSAISVKHLIVRYELERSQVIANNTALEFNEALSDQENALAATGSQIGDINQADAAAIRTALTRVRPYFSLANRLNYATLDGRVLGSSDAAVNTGSDANANAATANTAQVALTSRDYFQAVLRTKAAAIDKSVLVNAQTNTPFIAIAAPILTPAGDMIGVLIEVIDISRISTIVNQIRVGRTGYAQLAAADGTLVASPNEESVKQYPNVSSAAFWNQVNAGRSGLMPSYVGLSGHERMGAFATVPISGWKLWLGRDVSEIDSDAAGTYENALGWVIGAILLAAIAAFLLGRGLSRPIESLRGLASRIAGGDLSQRAAESGPREIAELGRTINDMAREISRNAEQERAVKARLETAVKDFGAFTAQVAAGNLGDRLSVVGDDELAQLGRGLNAMTESLSLIVGEIQGAAMSLESAAAEILAATSQQVAATAEEATAVRQTATTVAEVRQTTEVSTRKTRQVAEMAEKIETTAEDGRRSVAETVQGSEEAKSRMEVLAERILAFSDQAQEIAEINAAVSELAQKSNLLAVNASIEAAKAGEAGRGFSVVANEIKDLADRSKDATVQVRRIVAEIQKSAQGAVIAAEQGVKGAEAGMSVAERSGAAIGALAEPVAQASQAARQITAAAEQQQAGMDQINLAMRNIEQSSAQTVAATQQVERAARDLNQLARKLTGIVGSTKIAAAA